VQRQSTELTQLAESKPHAPTPLRGGAPERTYMYRYTFRMRSIFKTWRKFGSLWVSSVPFVAVCAKVLSSVTKYQSPPLGGVEIGTK